MEHDCYIFLKYLVFQMENNTLNQEFFEKYT